jgi:hypothetical protein
MIVASAEDIVVHSNSKPTPHSTLYPLVHASTMMMPPSSPSFFPSVFPQQQQQQLMVVVVPLMIRTVGSSFVSN